MKRLNLSFQDCQTGQEIEDRFRILSSNLISNYKIQTPSGLHRIKALELYLYTNHMDIHRDEWCDQGLEQLNSETWYVKNIFLKRSRIDITCGTKEKNLYAAFLVQMLEGQSVDLGSGTALRTLLRGSNSDTNWIKTPQENELLKEVHGKSIWRAPFKLVDSEPEKKRVLFIPRKFSNPKGRKFESSNLRAMLDE
jgi:hypothetical protein